MYESRKKTVNKHHNYNVSLSNSKMLLDCLTLDHVTDMLLRNVTCHQYALHNIPEA